MYHSSDDAGRVHWRGRSFSAATCLSRQLYILLAEFSVDIQLDNETDLQLAKAWLIIGGLDFLLHALHTTFMICLPQNRVTNKNGVPHWLYTFQYGLGSPKVAVVMEFNPWLSEIRGITC